MIQVSSNLTLFLKIFIPTFYLVFFGAMLATIWTGNFDRLSPDNTTLLRWGSLAIYLAVLAVFYFTIIQLKRVEMNGEGVYVTNYLKHYQYSYDSIEKIEEKEFPFVKIIQIHLHQSGAFGKKISFLPSKSRFNQFVSHFPAVAKKLITLDKA